MSTFGDRDMAIAPTTLCRMPPLSSWGKAFRRVSGDGILTLASSSAAIFRSFAAGPLNSMRSDSINWLPMVKTGLRDVSGSCITMQMPLPRTCRISEALASSKF